METKIINYFNLNKDAFTSIGILVTFFVSSISLYFSVRNNKAVHYVNSVTKSRLEWIQRLRNTVAEFIANTNIYNNAYYKNDYEKTGIHLSKCQQLCSEIKLLLNYCDEEDKKIIDLVEKILELYRQYCDLVHNVKVDEEGYFIESSNMKSKAEQVEENISLLTKKIQIYLKAEWNRVKYESQGKIYEKDTQKFDYMELEKKYEDSSYKNNVLKRVWINFKAKLKRKLMSPKFLLSILLIGTICIIA